MPGLATAAAAATAGVASLLAAAGSTLVSATVVPPAAAPPPTAFQPTLVLPNNITLVGLYEPVLSSQTGEQVLAWRSLQFGTAGRWQAPQAAPFPPNSIIQASQYKLPCLQASLPLVGSEDCLHLTVRRPANNATDLPVLAYIHGGGLMGGSSIWEDLSAFTAHANAGLGVVTVALNYRLNIFGYAAFAEFQQGVVVADNPASASAPAPAAALSDSPASEVEAGPSPPFANFGFLDQQLALQWIRDNIAAFGGNASQVTVAGQSSGGTSIFALLSSPGSRGLFDGAISLSGSPNISISLPAAQQQNAPVVQALNCSWAGSTAQQRLACLQNCSAEQLVAAIPSSWNTPGMWGIETLSPGGNMGYKGLTVVDGSVLTMPFPEALASGLVDVPLLMGNMGAENDLAPDVVVAGYSQQQWAEYLNSTLQPWQDAFPSLPPLSASVEQYYQNQALLDSQLAYDWFNTDYGLTCANIQLGVLAKAGAGAGGGGGGGNYSSPLYLFVNNWAPAVPIPTGNPAWNITYAFHTWDYAAALENWNSINPLAATQPQQSDLQLSQMLQELWSDFLQDGQLNGPTAQQIGWRSVEQVQGFPAHYGVAVLGTESQPPLYSPSSWWPDYKATICQGLLQPYGLTGAGYWWVN